MQTFKSESHNKFASISIATMTVLAFWISTQHVQADVVAMSGFESYDPNFVDVTLQPLIGEWTKLDSPNPVTNQGELVTSGPFGAFAPLSGNVFLDLRTESQYSTGGDGADYYYTLNSHDFAGLDPATTNSGEIALNYWTCPDTWSGDLGFFVPEGIYQVNSIRNGDGDVLASVGMYSLGNQNSPEVRYSVDGINWLSTGLQADNGSWTEVELYFDLDNKTSRVGFTDASSTSFMSGDLAWSPAISDTSVQTLNIQMNEGVGKNFFDDFTFTATASAIAVPEPTSMLLVASIGVVALLRRKRRQI